MIRPGTIQELADDFVAGILDVIEEARSEHRAALARASASISHTLPQPAPGRRRGAARSKAAPKVGTAQPKPRTGAAAASARAPARSNGAAAASAPPARPQETAAPVVRPQRETLVLDAVRSLGQATAAEIARQGGLPNGTAYVVLRSLLARGEVARADTARGVEYKTIG